MKKLIIFSLVCALLTGFAVHRFASELERNREIPTQRVVTATRRIEKDTLITAAMLQVVNWPKEAVHPLAVSETGALIGMLAGQTIEADELILSTKVIGAKERDAQLSYALNDGYRALTIRTDEIVGVAGYIKKGDRVDIVEVTRQEREGTINIVSNMVMEHVEVIRVGMYVDHRNQAIAYASITVSVAAEDVLRLTYALSESKIRLVLRSVTDDAVIDPPEYTAPTS